jgi:hypothetical protein
MRPYPIESDLCPPQAGERPNGRCASWRAAKRPEGAPAIEATNSHINGHRK